MNLTKSEKKVLLAWFIFGLIVLIIVSIIQVNKIVKEKENISGIASSTTNEIIDRNKYYTVASAINKYYTFLNNKDYDSVFKILDEDYVSANNINESNISTSDISLSYKTKIMCLKSYKDGVITYVVDGNVVSMNTGNFIEEKYYEVVMDGNNLTFSLSVITNTEYEGVCNG